MGLKIILDINLAQRRTDGGHRHALRIQLLTHLRRFLQGERADVFPVDGTDFNRLHAKAPGDLQLPGEVRADFIGKPSQVNCHVIFLHSSCNISLSTTCSGESFSTSTREIIQFFP